MAMESVRVRRRLCSSDTSSETDCHGRIFNRAERPLRRRPSSSASGSDTNTEICELSKYPKNNSQLRLGRTSSRRSRKPSSSPDRGECSTLSRRKGSSLSLNTSSMSSSWDDDSSPETRKREWLPSSSMDSDSLDSKTRSTRHSSSSLDLDIEIRRDVQANNKKEEYFSTKPHFSLSGKRKHISVEKMDALSSTYKCETETESRHDRNISSSRSKCTISLKTAKKARNPRHTHALTGNSPSPEIRLSTSNINHSSVLPSNEILVKTKHRRVQKQPSSSSESSNHSSFHDNARSSICIKKKRGTRPSKKKRSSKCKEKTRNASSHEKRSTRRSWTTENSSSSEEANPSLSRSDSFSHDMPRSNRHSPVRFERQSHTPASKNTQSFSSGKDSKVKYNHNESMDAKRSSCFKSQHHYDSPSDRKHSHRENRSRTDEDNVISVKDNMHRTTRRTSDYKPRDNVRDINYMKVKTAVKKKHSSLTSSSASESVEFENEEQSRKRRRLNESDSDSRKVFKKTKVRSVALMPVKSLKDRDRQDCYLHTDVVTSSCQKQRSLRDVLLVQNCCQHSDDVWRNFNEIPVDYLKSPSAANVRKDESRTTSGSPYHLPLIASPKTPSRYHMDRSPQFSSPSFIANMSPRSTLKGLDQPYRWALDLLIRSQSYHSTFVDSHCHIDLLYDRLGLSHETRFSEFRKMVANSFPGNFEGCVAVFCYPKTYDPINPQNQLFTTLAHDDSVWFAIGCHPKNAQEFTARHEQGLRKALRQPKVVALGEVGLDYSGNFHRHKETQKMVLRKQLQIAMEMTLPLVLHCRDAYDDCLAILMETVPRNWPIHLHCFCGNPETANIWLENFSNLYIGLTPVITFRTAHGSINTARSIPLNRLLLETDSPYFVPGSIPKGQSSVSHPGFALFTAERIAELKNVSVDTVLQTCRRNTYNVYGI